MDTLARSLNLEGRFDDTVIGRDLAFLLKGKAKLLLCVPILVALGNKLRVDKLSQIL